MTLSQGYRQQQAIRKPCLDYPYLSLPDIEEEEVLKEQDNEIHISSVA